MNTRAPNINRSRIHEDMVQRLAMQKLPGTDRTLFPTIRELLCFAALLGYSENRRLPLDKDKGVEDVSYQQFERSGVYGSSRDRYFRMFTVLIDYLYFRFHFDSFSLNTKR